MIARYHSKRAGHRVTKAWSVERIGQHQWRVSVQGIDAAGREQCRQFMRATYRRAVSDAAATAAALGLSHPLREKQ